MLGNQMPDTTRHTRHDTTQTRHTQHDTTHTIQHDTTHTIQHDTTHTTRHGTTRHTQHRPQTRGSPNDLTSRTAPTVGARNDLLQLSAAVCYKASDTQGSTFSTISPLYSVHNDCTLTNKSNVRHTAVRTDSRLNWTRRLM